MVYLGPTGTRLLISGGPLVEIRRKELGIVERKQPKRNPHPTGNLLTALYPALHRRRRYSLNCQVEDLGVGTGICM